MAKPSPTAYRGPPDRPWGPQIRDWLRDNLFSSIPNTILTLFAMWLVWMIVPPIGVAIAQPKPPMKGRIALNRPRCERGVLLAMYTSALVAFTISPMVQMKVEM